MYLCQKKKEKRKKNRIDVILTSMVSFHSDLNCRMNLAYECLEDLSNFIVLLQILLRCKIRKRIFIYYLYLHLFHDSCKYINITLHIVAIANFILSLIYVSFYF